MRAMMRLPADKAAKLSTWLARDLARYMRLRQRFDALGLTPEDEEYAGLLQIIHHLHDLRVKSHYRGSCKG